LLQKKRAQHAQPWEQGEAWKWRRRLFAWEEEKVRECCDILTNIVLQPNHYDRWI